MNIFDLVKKANSLFPHADKVVHAVIGVAAALFSLLFVQALVAWGISVVVGLAIEIGQLMTGTGKSSYLDWAAVALGGLVVFLV